MTSHPEMVRLIRVFVSSPGDVAEERRVLDDVVERINRIDGSARGARIELWKWEADVVPKIGPEPQQAVDEQMPPRYDIYLGIMKHRFGTPTGRHGSGTEKEFEDALMRWGEVGSPWILFYFGKEKVDLCELSDEQFAMVAKVKKFRERLQKKGLYATYEGVIGGSKDAFFYKVDEHLRKLLHRLVPLRPGSVQSLPADPRAYLEDLLSKTAYIDIRGLQVGQKRVQRFPIEDLFISLTATQTKTQTGKKPKKGGRNRH